MYVDLPEAKKQADLDPSLTRGRRVSVLAWADPAMQQRRD